MYKTQKNTHFQFRQRAMWRSDTLLKTETITRKVRALPFPACLTLPWEVYTWRATLLYIQRFLV